MTDLSNLDGLMKEIEARDSKIKDLQYRITRLQDLAIKGQKMTEEGRFIKTPLDTVLADFPHNSLKEYDKALKKENRTPEEVEELAWVREWGEAAAQKLYEQQWNANVAAGTARGENPYRGKRFNESS